LVDVKVGVVVDVPDGGSADGVDVAVGLQDEGRCAGGGGAGEADRVAGAVADEVVP